MKETLAILLLFKQSSAHNSEYVNQSWALADFFADLQTSATLIWARKQATCKL